MQWALIFRRHDIINFFFLSEEVEAELKEAAVISMGTEVSELDLLNIKELCDQVLALSEYRAQLYDYLRSRMNTIAPNLTALVGELVGARLIAHGGSLLNLAKQPSSTVQILGAEKALFRALKTKHATPKYGLIFHASLVGQAAPKLKGKISRSLAAKTALAIRCDALGDGQDNSMGLEHRVKLETRLRVLEGRELGHSAGSTKGKPKIEVYDKDRKKGAGALIATAKTYNPSSDLVLNKHPETTPEVPAKKRKHEEVETAEDIPAEDDGEKKRKKKKKAGAESTDLPDKEQIADAEADEGSEKKKKKKKKEEVHIDQITEEATEEPTKKEKKKKRKQTEDAEDGSDLKDQETEVASKKKDKKKKEKKRGD
ncbi:putative nucleolar protein 5-2 [Iris pallida]|uniref:Nucleolar protein 5-2 n=1 Tax=Iris pallida TaxID=29817 RepID=A0AAX6IAV7_IRIPA|nr:putative nucleolar protein 5-2 [Iris pallida]